MKAIKVVDIDVDESLRETENFLRDNMFYILRNRYGAEWINRLGVTKGK